MQLKHFLLLFFVLGSRMLFANNTPVSTEPSLTILTEQNECNLPAPSNFQVEALGATWVTFSWGTAGVVANRIRLYRSSDNALLSTTIVPAGTWSATITIPFNTPVYAKINSICSDGTNSIYDKVSGTITGIILELVVNGYNGNFNTSYCQIVNSGECILPSGSVNQFRVSYNGQVKKFGMEVISMNRYKLHLSNPNTGASNTFSFYCMPNINPENSCITTQIKVTYWNNGIEEDVATITAYRTGENSHKLTATTSNGGSIERLILGFHTPGDERGEEGPAPIAAVAPNPFQDGFDVFLDASAQEVSLQLFNLSGQKVFDQQFTGGQEQYSVPAVGLAPGFYLLRVEADGAVQTLKVVKSE